LIWQFELLIVVRQGLILVRPFSLCLFNGGTMIEGEAQLDLRVAGCKGEG
jgi:hypothetical protein